MILACIDLLTYSYIQPPVPLKKCAPTSINMEKREKLSRLASLQKLKKKRNKEIVSEGEKDGIEAFDKEEEANDVESGNESSHDDDNEEDEVLL